MRLRSVMRSLSMARLIVRCASLLVPREGRAEWLAEWNAEVWHVWHAGDAERDSESAAQGKDTTTAFCLGAFADALWLRRNNLGSVWRYSLRLGSASRCTFTLAACAAASVAICLCLPEARKAILPLRYQHASELVMISAERYSAGQRPSIRVSDYRSWKGNTQHLFTDLAFYQPMVKRVHLGRYQSAELTIALASANLFELLKVTDSSGDTRLHDQQGPRLILTERASRKYLHGDSQAAGRIVEIGGNQFVVSGVVADDSWQLPGKIDGWMLEDEQQLDTLPAGTEGFVLAHVRSSGFPSGVSGERSMNVAQAGGGSDRYDCISLAQRVRQPISIFLFTWLLALLALPATTPLPLGEYPAGADRLPRMVRARRWVFLAAKFIFIVPIVSFGSLDLAYSGWFQQPSTCEYVQLAASFFGLLFAFRWALQDQRKRCPTCLRLLSNPARVGQASRSFLAWNGTELICAGGHGLLHIPELPTSWFGTQRWLYLDPSWSGLFSDGYIPSAGTV